MVRSHLPITAEYFKKRLIDLCLRSGLSGFPKHKLDQQILLKSAALNLGKSNDLTENEVNEKLKYWIKHISQIDNFDHVTLRRWLVDTGYLTRSKDGSCYQTSWSEAQQQIFDDEVNELNIKEVIKTGREEIERKKQEYLKKLKGK